VRPAQESERSGGAVDLQIGSPFEWYFNVFVVRHAPLGPEPIDRFANAAGAVAPELLGDELEFAATLSQARCFRLNEEARSVRQLQTMAEHEGLDQFFPTAALP